MNADAHESLGGASLTDEILRSVAWGQLDLPGCISEVCDRIDDVEPKAQAMLPEPNRRERLLHEPERLRERFPDPAKRPPLCGVFVGGKDILRVDGFETRCGSKLSSELFAGPEAECLTMLRNAGALILGKTVTTEFACFEPGPTRNPHNLERTPGGSSSGSAAAVAAGFCPPAPGTQPPSHSAHIGPARWSVFARSFTSRAGRLCKPGRKTQPGRLHCETGARYRGRSGDFEVSLAHVCGRDGQSPSRTVCNARIVVSPSDGPAHSRRAVGRLRRTRGASQRKDETEDGPGAIDERTWNRSLDYSRGDWSSSRGIRFHRRSHDEPAVDARPHARDHDSRWAGGEWFAGRPSVRGAIHGGRTVAFGGHHVWQVD